MKRTEHTQKWLDALRSGEYEQGRGFLELKGNYCCLGVAAAVVGIPTDESGENYERVRNALGISRQEQDDLTTLNDVYEKPFTEIADEIESILEPEACQ